MKRKTNEEKGWGTRRPGSAFDSDTGTIGAYSSIGGFLAWTASVNNEYGFGDTTLPVNVASTVPTANVYVGTNDSSSDSRAAMSAIHDKFAAFPNICTHSLSLSVSAGPISLRVSDTQGGTTFGVGGTVKWGNLVRITGTINNKADVGGTIRYGGLIGIAANPDTGMYGVYAGKIVSFGEGFKLGGSVTAMGKDVRGFYCGKP